MFCMNHLFKSSASNPTSIASEAAVPNPGNVDKAPEASSAPARSVLPAANSETAKPAPTKNPSIGIFFNMVFVAVLAPVFDATLTTVFPVTLVAIFENPPKTRPRIEF
jgi:hypothetical protein